MSSIKEVNQSYLSSMLLVAVDIFAAFIVACFIHCCLCSCYTEILVTWSRVLGLLIIGGAVLGRLGWTIQTFGGTTPPEEQNKFLFRLFYLIGIFFTALSIFL